MILQIVNAREDMEKKEPSYTVGGNVSWCSHYGKAVWRFLKNLELPYDLAMPTWAYIWRKPYFEKIHIHQH